MSDSVRSTETRLQVQAGPNAKAKSWTNRRQQRRHQIKCLACKDEGRMWWSRSDSDQTGQGSSLTFALDEWAHHLDKRHHDLLDTCPWAEQIDAVNARRGQRREKEDQALAELHRRIAELHGRIGQPYVPPILTAEVVFSPPRTAPTQGA